ncbi:MAG: FG-GAP repeat protein [Gammaproteobacteria bacterium]
MAYVFTDDGSGWSQQAELQACNADTGDAFGYSIGLSGERLVVGADQESGDASSSGAQPNNSASQSGTVYMFMHNKIQQHHKLVTVGVSESE